MGWAGCARQGEKNKGWGLVVFGGSGAPVTRSAATSASLCRDICASLCCVFVPPWIYIDNFRIFWCSRTGVV